MNGVTTITAQDDLDRMIAAVAQSAPWLLPLYRAVRAGQINVIEPRRAATVKKALLADTRRPCIVLLGDDDYESTGPAGWACARRVKAWSTVAFLHAAAGEPHHYEAAVVASAASRRLLLVETSSTHRDAWLHFLAPKPVHVIATHGDEPHPAIPSTEQVH